MANLSGLLHRAFPILTWLPNYKKENTTGDVFAGLTIGIMLIPQGMAYALLAGLPPIHGLYAGMITLFVYSIFGTSRQLSIGPVAMDSLLLANGLAGFAVSGSAEYMGLAVLVAFMVGFIQMSLGFLRLGFLVNFVSNPVISGFSSAAAIIIAFSQLKHLLGIPLEGDKIHQIIYSVITNISEIHIISLALGVMSIFILKTSHYIHKSIPRGLLVIVINIILVYVFKLNEAGVKILKDVPAGLPDFKLPDFDFTQMSALLPLAFTLAFISFMESIASARALQMKHKTYKVVPNQELIAVGASNMSTSMLNGMPVAGSFSRSAINNEAGAKTGLASMISSAIILLVLLFLTSWFYYLPYTVLAAIVISAVFSLVNIKLAKKLWRSNRRDFIVFMTTAFATLFFHIEAGILTGVLLSLGLLIFEASYPHIVELGRIPGTPIFRNILRFQNLEVYDNLLMIRFDAQLFFANSHSLREFIENRILEKPTIKHVILEASAINSLDATAVDMVVDLNNDLKTRDIELYMVNVKGPVRDTLEKNGLMHEHSDQYYFLNMHDAVQYINHDKYKDYSAYVLQTNE